MSEFENPDDDIFADMYVFYTASRSDRLLTPMPATTTMSPHHHKLPRLLRPQNQNLHTQSHNTQMRTLQYRSNLRTTL